jgi:outer membrane protein OmpA-like peptidoglycan-associated protein
VNAEHRPTFARAERVARGAHLAEDRGMQRYTLCVFVLLALAGPARADDAFGALRSKVEDKAKGTANSAVVDKINAKLLDEGRKNQCSFKVDSDVLEPGCDAKAKRLANLLIDMKKQLAASNAKGYHFVVSGHTDSTGKADHNVELSKRRAAAIAKELVARGVPGEDITSVGMGSQKMLVKPDNTPAKKAKNRRYEIQVQL